MVALFTGCSGGSDDASAMTLKDGSPAREAPVELEGVEGPTVLTSTMALPVASVEPDSAAGVCLRGDFGHRTAEGSAVIRVAVNSESVTFREAPPARAVFGCDDSPGPREKNRRWCGGAYGQLASGRLSDPRLSIACRTKDGASVGFVWVEPAEDARFVAVDQPDYVEVYEPAGGLPVRIFTLSGVDVETSSATFDISEHDAEGNRLREYELEAFVAG